MKKRKAFTLVELVIAMAVITALLATLVPIAVNAVRKAEASQIARNLRAMQRAVEEYCLVHNPMTGPQNVDDLASGIQGRIDETLFGIHQVTGDGLFLDYFVYYHGENFGIKEVVEHFVDVQTGPIGQFGVYARLPVMW